MTDPTPSGAAASTPQVTATPDPQPDIIIQDGEQALLGEAGGIAYTDNCLLDPTTKIRVNLTARGLTTDKAATLLMQTVTRLLAQGWTIVESAKNTPRQSTTNNSASLKALPTSTGAPAKPAGAVQSLGAPVNVPGQVGGSGEVVSITSIAHNVTKNGTHCITCRGGKYVKWGLTLYPENIPADWQAFQQWNVGEFYALENPQNVLTDGTKVLKVL